MKPRIDLLPPKGIQWAGQVMGESAGKYPDEKWKTLTPKQHVESCLRHLFSWLGGEEYDEESDMPHLAHAAVRALMAIDRRGSGNGSVRNNDPLLPVPNRRGEFLRRSLMTSEQQEIADFLFETRPTPKSGNPAFGSLDDFTPEDWNRASHNFYKTHCRGEAKVDDTD